MELSYRELFEQVKAGTADFEMQLSLARGIYPLEPVERLDILILLLAARDDVLKKESLATLQKLPRSIILGVGGNRAAPPRLLDKLARLFSRREDILEAVLLNPSVDDRTVAYIATLPVPQLLEIIGRGQDRLEREDSIIENLRKNPETPATVISLWEEARGRREKEADAVPPAKPQEDAVEVEAPAILTEESEAEVVEGHKAVEAKKDTIIQLIRAMSAGERVAMAMKGNGEVRKVLIRDKNRLICEKVLENPRITDSEVESYAKSTNVAEEVLRNIGTNRTWTRQVGIVRSLINNPKTPLGISLGFIKRMPKKELESLSKNKNVPEALRNSARKMFKLKMEKKG